MLYYKVKIQQQKLTAAQRSSRVKKNRKQTECSVENL